MGKTISTINIGRNVMTKILVKNWIPTKENVLGIVKVGRDG